MNTLLKLFIGVTISIVVIAFSGCKNDNASRGENQETKIDSVSAIAQQDQEIENMVIPDLRGTWTGTFDKRSTVLNITEQTDSSFLGKISISYREIINQEVKGSFSTTTMKISMTDQLHSRYQGKYKGKLSEDGKNFSGTFTMDLDGKQFSFNLNKK